MYICSYCKEVVEELPTIREAHPYASSVAYERYLDTDCHCGNGEYEVAYQCKECLEYFLEEVLNSENLCPNCSDEEEEE